MRLSDYVREDLVVHDLAASDMDGVLDAVGTHLVESGFLLSKDDAVKGLRAREEAHTTNLGGGIAVPHATIAPLPEALLLVARTRAPVPFGPEGNPPVDLFFVLLSPPGREGEHIKLLARICRLARHPGFLEELRLAKGGNELIQTILRVDVQHV